MNEKIFIRRMYVDSPLRSAKGRIAKEKPEAIIPYALKVITYIFVLSDNIIVVS